MEGFATVQLNCFCGTAEEAAMLLSMLGLKVTTEQDPVFQETLQLLL